MNERRNVSMAVFEIGFVVLVLSVLAALVVPTVMRKIKERRTIEATENLRVLFNASVEYYQRQLDDDSLDPTRARFPAGTPAHPPAIGRRPVTTSDWHMVDAFRELGFEITEPHFYQYAYESEGEGENARFTVSAFGDLDGDGHTSRFQMEGYVEGGEVRGRTIVVDRLE